VGLPTLERSYEFNVNNSVLSTGGANDDRRLALWNLHSAMTGMVNNPWTVVGSCNAVSYGYPGPGWSSIADIVWGNTGATKSWIIWQTASGAQICFVCASNSTGDQYRYMCGMRYSPEGRFSGGTLSAYPSADDQHILAIPPDRWAPSTAIFSWVEHYIHSTDGLQTLIIHCQAGYNYLGWMTGEVLDPVTNYTLNNFFFAPYQSDPVESTNRMTYSDLLSSEWLYGKQAAVGGAGNIFRARFSTEGVYSDAVGEYQVVANELSGEWPMTKLGFFSNDIGAEGRHGRVNDLWLTSTALATGDTLETDPLSPTYDFAVFGNLVVPWNGTIPVTTYTP